MPIDNTWAIIVRKRQVICLKWTIFQFLVACGVLITAEISVWLFINWGHKIYKINITIPWTLETCLWNLVKSMKLFELIISIFESIQHIYDIKWSHDRASVLERVIEKTTIHISKILNFICTYKLIVYFLEILGQIIVEILVILLLNIYNILFLLHLLAFWV